MKLSSEIGGGHVLHAPSGHGLLARCGQVSGLLQTSGRITPAVVGTIALDAGAPWVVPIRINAHTCSFMQNLKSKSDLPSWCSWVDLLRIQISQATLQGKDPAIRLLLWYPAYGSVVVAHAFDDQQFVGTVSVVVLGLDGFHLSLQPRPGQATYDYTGRAPTYVSLFVGTVDETLLDQASNKFDNLLSDAQSRHDAQRSAGRNEQGHQHTPAMIHALWKQASVCMNAAGCTSASGAVPPKGGMTDCGLHTGSQIRNTSFPLVRS